MREDHEDVKADPVDLPVTLPEIEGLIRDFLEERREVIDGGWAEVKPDDLCQLRAIVAGLVELKFEPDADMDRPIDFRLINRATHEPLHFMPVPYRTKAKSMEEREEILSYHLENLMTALARVSDELRHLRYERLQAAQAKAVSPPA